MTDGDDSGPPVDPPGEETATHCGGTYVLLVEVPGAAAVEVGALGTRSFEAGWYAYVGSALGPGGFARLDRHRRVAAGEHDVRHWHVDYLLGETAARIVGDERLPGVDLECAVAASLPGDRVAGFGASDCDCDSHLVRADSRVRLRHAAARSHRDARTQRRD